LAQPNSNARGAAGRLAAGGTRSERISGDGSAAGVEQASIFIEMIRASL
jgi:hypothetical protein